MKQWGVGIMIASMITSSCTAHVPRSAFMQAVATYRLDAVWLQDAFSRLNLDDFIFAWRTVVDILTHDATRWFYFCDTREHGVGHTFRDESLAQCKKLDSFLQTVRVNPSTHTIMYEETASHDLKTCTIYEYWKMCAERSYYRFYAFYFDCLADYFLDADQTAYGNLISDHQFAYAGVGFLALDELKRIAHHLVGSSYERRYLFQLERYQQLVELLADQALMHMGVV